MRIELYRGFKIQLNAANDFVGQYEGKVVDLLGNSEYIVVITFTHALIIFLPSDVTFNLMDKAGVHIPAKLKIVISHISGPVDNINGFMEQVDISILHLPPKHDTLVNAASILGPILQLTKQILDKFLNKASKVIY